MGRVNWQYTQLGFVNVANCLMYTGIGYDDCGPMYKIGVSNEME